MDQAQMQLRETIKLATKLGPNLLDHYRVMKFIIFTLLTLVNFAYGQETIEGHKPTINTQIEKFCKPCVERMKNETGAYILEYGEEALLSRAWLADNATSSIDIQYFIWSTDNIGILASEALLRAAERGVKVRVIVDDFMINAENEALIALNSHNKIDIKIYNPKHSVGTSAVKRLFNIATNIRGVNQRMHDKTAIFDNAVGITGGRNMADEYFDYDPDYNFRDRDILLMGAAVKDMTENFNDFWGDAITVSVDDLLKYKKKRMTEQQITTIVDNLHSYASQENNFEEGVKQKIKIIPEYFPSLVNAMYWGDVSFVSDKPGKNDSRLSLSGGGEITDILIDQINQATKSIVIQSPYLIIPGDGIELFKELVDKGVKVSIVTNSLASTDNMMAFSGYHNQRKELLKADIDIYEFKPHPAIQEKLVNRYPRLKGNNPIFALHAKSMVIDDKVIYIGTFNLDPRSANLNTEVGVLINNSALAHQLKESILKDMQPENSWKITTEFNPDGEVSLAKRLKLRAMKLLPMKKLL